MSMITSRNSPPYEYEYNNKFALVHPNDLEYEYKSMSTDNYARVQIYYNLVSAVKSEMNFNVPLNVD